MSLNVLTAGDGWGAIAAVGPTPYVAISTDGKPTPSG